MSSLERTPTLSPSQPIEAPALFEPGTRVQLALFALALLGIGGALLSYREDVREARTQVESSLHIQGVTYADALATHLGILQSELQRIANQPSLDSATLPNAVQTMSADSLFGGGIAFVNLKGRVQWSVPSNLFEPNHSVLNAAWFQKLLVNGEPVIDSIDRSDPQLVFGLPVDRGRTEAGMLLGMLNPSNALLFGPGVPNGEVLVVNSKGDVLLPTEPTSWTSSVTFLRWLEQTPKNLVSQFEADNVIFFAWHAPVKATTLSVVVVAEQEQTLRPIRNRLLPQLVFLAGLQVVSVAIFAIFLRLSYQRLRTMEQQHAEQGKLAALGIAASLIAHEIKNSLNSLGGAVSLLSSPEDTPLAQTTLKGQLERLRHLARSLLNFGKPAKALPSNVRMDELVHSTIAGLQLLPEFAEVAVLTIDALPLTARGDGLLLMSALDNVIRNAIEAVVAARDVGRCDSPTVRIVVRQDADSVVVVVEDNGGGPAVDFEQKWRAPFYTTKAKGIGLGLAMARQVIEAQAGRLSFERTADGSRFVLTLPGGRHESQHLAD